MVRITFTLCLILTMVGICLAAQGKPSSTLIDGAAEENGSTHAEQTSKLDKGANNPTNLTMVIESQNPSPNKPSDTSEADENVAI